MINPVDICGKEINVGDIIVYPARSVTSAPELKFGKVLSLIVGVKGIVTSIAVIGINFDWVGGVNGQYKFVIADKRSTLMNYRNALVVTPAQLSKEVLDCFEQYEMERV